MSTPVAPRRSGRTRVWLLVIIIASITGSLIAGWVFYVGTFTSDRFGQLPPGAAFRNNNGFSIRVLRLIARPSIPGTIEPDPAPPGAVFVVADLEVTAPDPLPAEGGCSMELVGRGGRTWESSFQSLPDIPSGCSDLLPGETGAAAVVYTVPAAELGSIYGLGFENFDGSRDMVIRP